MGDQDKISWVADARTQLRDPLNAGIAAQMQRAIELESQNVFGFCSWLASNSMHLEATPNPTMGGEADETFFLKLSVPTLVAAWMGSNVRGATLDAARNVLVQRYLEDDDTQARIIKRARQMALDKLHEEQLSRSEHGALFQRLATADVVEG